MITQKKTANAIGGKTARACESCLKRRAKWFCAPDDAFLCNACDSLVHSANDLASRHPRVCLDTSKPPQQHQQQQPPSWHQGFTKKARTPRKSTNKKTSNNSNKSFCKYSTQMMSVVPEVGNDDEFEDDGMLLLLEEEKNSFKECIKDDDDQMIFSVPNLDDDDDKGFREEGVISLDNYNEGDDGELFNFSLMGYDHDVHGWELAEFAADVESLLEQEEEEEGGGVITKGMMKHEQEGSIISANNNNCDHSSYFDWSIDVESEMFSFDLNENYGEYFGGNNNEFIGNKSHHHHHHQVIRGEEEEEGDNGKVVVPIKDEVVEESSNNNVGDYSREVNNKKRKIVSRLNYDEVINAWASQGCSSPWTTGRRPEFDLDHHGWPFCMRDLCPNGVDQRGNVKGGDGGREARVLRYREKRRTRLFSKKIRYEVRKLNAEKRPRLKGRFVKRTSLSQSGC